MAAKKLQTLVRREQIAMATLKLAAAGGIGAVSMSKIAGAVGVVPSALYRHFKNKDEALDAAVTLMIDKLIAHARHVGDRSADAVRQLQALLRRHVGLIHKNQGILQIVFSLDFYVDHPERRQRVYGGLREYLALVAGIIRSGQRAGQIHLSLNPATAAVIFLGLVQPSAILWQMSGGQFDVRTQARRAWPLYRGMLECGTTSFSHTSSGFQDGGNHDRKKHKYSNGNGHSRPAADGARSGSGAL